MALYLCALMRYPKVLTLQGIRSLPIDTDQPESEWDYISADQHSD